METAQLYQGLTFLSYATGVIVILVGVMLVKVLFDVSKLFNISKNYISKMTSEELYTETLIWAKEFDLEFENPVFEIIPTAHGKNVNIHNENKEPRE